MEITQLALTNRKTGSQSCWARPSAIQISLKQRKKTSIVILTMRHRWQFVWFALLTKASSDSNGLNSPPARIHSKFITPEIRSDGSRFNSIDRNTSRKSRNEIPSSNTRDTCFSFRVAGVILASFPPNTWASTVI